MFNSILLDELSRHMGSRVLIVTDNYEGEGILMSMVGDLIVLHETEGYGNETTAVNIPVDGINFVRILSTTV
ncbi:hypothetical protein [Metabacillus fastidiosus]|uniref:hypothetical protein n=1 Tax=Metabacillus fastidiosus TaxID=1458 RepID=UPI002E20312C|nr:hypothetical protein [Metabacillus fastidiosus]